MLGMEDVAAYVIAGGRSSRMGRDKAFLSLQGTTLLERALAVARAASPQVTIVGPREKFAAYGNVVEDLYAGQGPLAGIHAALSSSASELNLVIGVDMPFLDPRFVAYMVDEARKSGAIVTFPATERSGQWAVVSGQPTENREPETRNSPQAQPLCAVYRREFAAIAENALRQGRNAIVPLFANVTVRQVGENEMRELAFDPRMFDNLNTPEEWDQACRRVQS